MDERPTTPGQAAIDYAAFFRAEFAAVTRTAYLVLHDRDAAEDIAQDAFTQLHLHWAKISTYEARDGSAFGGAWSPDGEWIVFTLDVGPTNSDIYIMRSDGTDLHQVTDTPSQDEEFADWG